MTIAARVHVGSVKVAEIGCLYALHSWEEAPDRMVTVTRQSQKSGSRLDALLESAMASHWLDLLGSTAHGRLCG